MTTSGADGPRRKNAGPRASDAGPRPVVRPVLASSGRFPREARILLRREFQRVQREGVRIRTAAFTVVARASLAGRPRLGLAVGRKIGGAAVRNRIKRVLRELFRRTASSLPPVDLVMMAQPDAVRLSKEGLASVAEIVLPAWGRASERALSRPRAARPRRGRRPHGE